MSDIDYRDFAFSSEEETDEQKSSSDEDEDHNTDDDSDIDEYASFDTEVERYQYDQVRYQGIPNQRKYQIAKKTNKGEDQKKIKAGKQDKPQSTRKSAKQDKPKALPKSRKEQESQVEKPVEVSQAGEIRFDCEDNLWYTYHKGNDRIYISERATFHHWIRPGLSRGENAKGTYDFLRKKGPGNHNTTCFNEVQEHWGLERPHYAPVMFEWERLDRKNPTTYELGNLYYQGLLVLDYWRMPVLNFREIPLVISSAFEGAYMEPATRLHSLITYEDIRARMPPFVEVSNRKAITKVKALSKSSALSARSRHFREKAGAIAWDKREGSSNIKSFIEDIVKPLNNSTRGSRNLTKDEIHKLRLMNHGTKPGRAKPGTTKKAKDKYIADVKKAAGQTLRVVSPQNVQGENIDNQELEGSNEDMALSVGDPHQRPTDDSGEPFSIENGDFFLSEDQEGQSYDERMVSIERENNQKDGSMVVDANGGQPQRLLFRCVVAPHLQAMTEEESLTHPLVDYFDPRNCVPKFSNEIEAIRDALKVTVDHFEEICGIEPTVYNGGNYISEYCTIQDQLDELFLYEAPALRRLERWEGSIFDWWQAGIEQDPCIGRKNPF